LRKAEISGNIVLRKVAVADLHIMQPGKGSAVSCVRTDCAAEACAVEDEVIVQIRAKGLNWARIAPRFSTMA
jgi:hypothetical protein